MMKRLLSKLKRFAHHMGPEHFDHRKAQEYELRSSERFIRKNFDDLYFQIEKAKAKGELWLGSEDRVIKEFFAGSREEWGDFADYVKRKTCLEIGAGP